MLAKRAEHVLSENKRVRTGLAALQQGDLRAFGRLVNASGQSMVRLFDAGTPATVRILDLLQSDPDVVGATLSGAGFGGSLARDRAARRRAPRSWTASHARLPPGTPAPSGRISGIGSAAGTMPSI